MHRILRFGPKSRLGIAVLVAMLSAVGAAIAFWTGGGSGTGSAAATTNSALTVNQTTSITNLYPGAAAQTLSGNFDNPNTGKVYVHNVTASVHPFNSQTDPSKPACTQADFSIGGSATVDAEVSAGNGVGSWSGLNVSLTDNPAANQDNCKGLSIQIDYTAHAG